MPDLTPDPPDTGPASPDESLHSKELHDAAERALNHHYLQPKRKLPNTTVNSSVFAPAYIPKPYSPTPQKTCCQSAPSPQISPMMWTVLAALWPWQSAAWPTGCICWSSEYLIIWMIRKWRRYSPSNTAWPANSSNSQQPRSVCSSPSGFFSLWRPAHSWEHKNQHS